ncbi:MAG: ATP-binding cassette domain-containing protein [Streptosporangiales bacterium]|nr:ATP-binding cassette domain-containing protein [Streptosporangiales bacterium]
MTLTVSTGDHVIELDDVAMAYGDSDTPVIAGVDLRVERGEFVTLFGRSGCGKSTLLNIVAGLLPPTKGEVRFRGSRVEGVNTQVSYLTQEDTLLPWRSTRKNIELPLRLRGYPKTELRPRVDEYLELLNLREAADKYPAQLSGGMRRRTLIARSMVYEPSVLLMDEPFGAIDASLREELHEELRHAVEQLDLTVVFVSHDIAEAALLSDRVVVFRTSETAPTRLSSELEIPFGRPRDLAEIRLSTQYVELQRRLRMELDGEGSPASAGEVAR